MFIGPDEFPFAADGVTALSPFAAILNQEIATVTAEVVRVHRRWMEQHIPGDVLAWLERKSSRPVPIREQSNPFLRRDDESVDDYIARIDDLRIFDPNPFAVYEPAHTWVDPNGYTLSKRIWNTHNTARQKLDDLLLDGIAQGLSAREIANLAERWLLPGRKNLRTKKPYGTNGSFDAMRLARTEIARAAAQASYITAVLNPYVEKLDVARSPYGDPTCPICPQHATIGLSGERLHPPYPIDQVVFPPFHPHCLCVFLAVVVESTAEITQRLRGVMKDARQDLLVPVMTPAQADAFIVQLLGQHLTNLVLQLGRLIVNG
jgi:hypothetical protein